MCALKQFWLYHLNSNSTLLENKKSNAQYISTAEKVHIGQQPGWQATEAFSGLW